MIRFETRAGMVSPAQATGFFVGWPSPPTSEQLVAVMDGSYRRVWALDGNSVVGYINAISDGVLNAYLPWLEVLPTYQGQGIGRELVRRVLTELDSLYAIDLCCDPALIPYYEKLGFTALAGAGIRHYEALVPTKE